MSLASFAITQQLELLTQKQLRRFNRVSDGVTPIVTRAGRDYINFSSNDYLGLAQHPKVIAAAQDYLKDHGVGSGAAHLITGHTTVHEALEQRLARMAGYESTLLFSTGYMANMGTVDALMSSQIDRSNPAQGMVYHDKLNHASLLDGARLAGIHAKRYPHLDMNTLATWLAQDKADYTQNNNHQPFRQLIVTDQIFSMDGTEAPLEHLINLAQQHSAALMIDDAHGFGLRRKPLPTVDVYMATLGKAVGTFGAFVAGRTDLIDFLRCKARTFCFTTASPPLIAAATLAALDVIEQEPALQDTLAQHIQHFKTAIGKQGWQLLPSQTAIQPIVIGDVNKAMALSKALEDKGFLVVAIRPPTVPVGTSRLRITLSSAHSRTHIDDLIGALAELVGDYC